MALDFNKLLENPLFQTGLATLGGAGNPGLLSAYQALQAQKKAKLEQQQQEQQAELERARTDLWRQQIEASKAGLKQKEEAELRKQENLRNLPRLIQQLNSGQLSMEGQGSVTGSPMANTQSPQAQPGLALPPMTPAATPAEPLGKYGTPLRELANLKRTESGGAKNYPHVFGPLLPEGDRAMGPFQFRQSTIDMLKKEGIVFNPFDEAQSQDAADYYIQKLTKKHGGDRAKAYAEYGGFKAKDPTKYVSGIMGSPEKQAAQFTQHTNLAEQSAKYKRNQKLMAALALSTGDLSGGMKLYTESLKPDYEPAREARAEAGEQRSINADRRAEEAAQREALKPPKGYIRTPDGKLVPELTVEEGKATAYVTQMSDAQKTFEKLKKQGYDPTRLATQAGTALAGGVKTPIPGVTLPTNILATGIQQQAKQAQNMWAEAYLRFKTGAATNASEIATNVETFFPQFGDKKANIEQKERARKIVEKAVEVSAGRGIESLPPDLRKQFDEVTSGGGSERTVVRTGKRKDGTRVIQYSDGSIENVK